MPKSNRKALIFLMITVSLDSLGLGLIVPIIPELMNELTGRQGLSHAIIWGGLLMTLFAAAQFFCAPVLGNLSDAYGRRPVLLISLAALGVDYILTGLAPSIIWLFAGRLIAGMLSSTYGVANAYVADISSGAQRGKFFSYLGAAWGFGFILGPAVGGILGEYSIRLPFFCAAALSLANALYGYLVLPETLSDKNRRAFSWRRANTIASLRAVATYPAVLTLLFAVLFFQIAHDTLPATWSYFTILQLQWSSGEIGYSLAAVGLLNIFVMAILSPYLIVKIGEIKTAKIGMILASIGFSGLSSAQNTWQFYAWLIPWSAMGLVMPSIRTLMSRQVPANAQGELQGAISSIMGLTAVFTPITATQIFHYFSADTGGVYYPGAAFVLAALAMGCAFMMILLSTRKLLATQTSHSG